MLVISPYLNLKVNAPVLVVRMCGYVSGVNFHIVRPRGFYIHTTEITRNMRKNDFTGSWHDC